LSGTTNLNQIFNFHAKRYNFTILMWIIVYMLW
jgi:hypothetical protein